MRYVAFSVLLLFTLHMSAQKMTAGTFVSSGQVIHYNRIDYSGNGLGQIRIIMYEDNENNKDIYLNAANCLAQISNLYHTYYYFIKLPKDYKLQKSELALSEFLDQISKTPEYVKLKKVPILYIFSDKEYSLLYINQEKQPFKLQKVLTELSAQNICKGLL